MAYKLKGQIKYNQNSHQSCLVVKVNKLLKNPIKDLRPPFFNFKKARAAGICNINILSSVRRYLWGYIKF